MVEVRLERDPDQGGGLPSDLVHRWLKVTEPLRHPFSTTSAEISFGARRFIEIPRGLRGAPAGSPRSGRGIRPDARGPPRGAELGRRVLWTLLLLRDGALGAAAALHSIPEG